MTICMCIMLIAMCPVSLVTIKHITRNKLAFTFASFDNLNLKELGGLNLRDWLVRSQGLVSASLLWSHITLDYHHMECVVVR
jgi:hypothetical protein